MSTLETIPSTLKPFYNYEFSSGPYIGADFKSFDLKYKNAIKKLLPEGYSIHKWNRNHYESSCVIKDNEGRFIYLSYPDVRFFPHEWINNILIRTMKHEKDWTGGCNYRAHLFGLTESIQRLYR